VRAGDRLVKIGWSKRDRRAYEHRATRTAVLAVLDAVAAKIRPGKRFELDGIGEVSDATGKAVPTYQVYLTLRWLRDLGIISKRGKSDYVLTRVATRSDIETSWRELPEAA
jgi:DNA-binding transcriptional ArsR family regulator